VRAIKAKTKGYHSWTELSRERGLQILATDRGSAVEWSRRSGLCLAMGRLPRAGTAGACPRR
jgi:hypothetical protein